MMNKSCFCQNPDKVEIFGIKPQNFDAEIRAFFEVLCTESANGQKNGRIVESAEIKIKHVPLDTYSRNPLILYPVLTLPSLAPIIVCML